MYNHYHEEATREGKTILRVNLDETSVAVVPTPLRGVVMKTGCRLQAAAPLEIRREPLHATHEPHLRGLDQWQ